MDCRLLGFHPLLWILKAASAENWALSCNHSNAVIPSGVNCDPLESPGASRHIYSFLTCLLDAFYFIYVCVYTYTYM